MTHHRLLVSLVEKTIHLIMTPRTIATVGLRIFAIWLIFGAVLALLSARTPLNSAKTFYKLPIEHDHDTYYMEVSPDLGRVGRIAAGAILLLALGFATRIFTCGREGD